MELRKLKTFPIVIVWALIIVACNPATPTQAPTLIPTSIPTQVIENTATTSQSGLPQTEADVPRVSVEDTVAAIQSGEAIVVDVRSAQAYQASHIPGALSVPLFDIETDPASLKLDKDKWIITYCTWLQEHTSARAAFLLLQNGYKKVTPILGGFQAWIDAGQPVEP